MLACAAVYIENFVLKRKDEIDSAIRNVEDRIIQRGERIGNRIGQRLER